MEPSADLHALTALVSGEATTDVLDRALGALEAVIPYDLATVMRLDGDQLRVVAAAGPLADRRVRRHGLPLKRFPTIRRALEQRRPIALAEHHHASDEGDPFDGVLDLPHGHACMVIPLWAGGRDLGVITLDGRACGAYPDGAVRLAGVYGQIVALALVQAEQSAALDADRRQLRDVNRLLTEDAGGDQVAVQRLERCPSPAMVRLVALARTVAASDLPVLIQGETGTGKEVLASAVHALSRRAGRPFVKLNASSIPENLVESELFGHVRGAYSGADRDRAGRFVVANGGTLLLDEVGDMPLSAQARLLRVLQEGCFEPVGSDRTVRVDVRVIAATHVDLQAAVAQGRFRMDLYYRLAAFVLPIPPLRERREDILPLAEDALRARRRGLGDLSAEARLALQTAPWPGNVRELIHALERALALQPVGTIWPEHLGLRTAPLASAAPRATEAPLPDWEENERQYLRAVLQRSNDRIYGPGGAAQITGLKPTTLRSRLVKLGLR